MIDYDEILKYIQEEIVPKYSELDSCTMHILPKEFINVDVEYIFRIPFNLNKDDRTILTNNILKNIISVFGKSPTQRILIILSEF